MPAASTDTGPSDQWCWRDESQLLAAISATNPRLGFYALRLLDVDADRADEWPVAEEQQLGRNVAEIGQSILRRARIRTAMEQPLQPTVIDTPEHTRSGDDTDEHGQPTPELDR